MDTLMELIADFFVECVQEGVISLATSKRRIPKILRYILLSLIGVVSLLLIGLLVYAGFAGGDIIISLLLFLLAIAVAVYVIKIVKKVVSNLKKN